MRSMAGLIAGFGLLAGAACSSQPDPAEQGRPEIGPAEFALLPCGPGRAERPCALVVAGGKRVLLGAPAGIADSLVSEDLKYLDAVIILSLRAVDIEGLDEVRNASWQAGRQEPLLVVGPEGTAPVIEAINLAYEQADALRIVEEGMPPGGFDAALLVGEDLRGPGWVMAYDTGDLRIQVQPLGQARMPVQVNYQARVSLRPCGSQAGEDDPGADLTIACQAGDLSWPLHAPVFVVEN